MTGVSVALFGLALLLVPEAGLPSRRLDWLAAERSQLVAAASARPVPVRIGRLAARWLRSADRNGDRCREELAAVVTVLRDEYAAGATIASAFGAAAALPGRFQILIGRAAALAQNGRDVAPALGGDRRLAALAVACDLAGRNGAPLARSLAGVHAELAADQRTARAVRTALAGPRSSALLLAGLPLLGLVMGSAMGAAPHRVLLHSGAGRVALAVGLALELAGLAWTLALTRRALAGTRP